MIRVMLVDDHAVVREGYRRLLERRGDLRVEAEASSGAQAYRLYREIAPDVAILDLALPDMGGVELVRRIVQRDPAARLLVFSMHREPLFATQALRAGALGYVSKSCAPDVLLHAVYKVAERHKFISPDIASEVAVSLLAPADAPAYDLTPREFEILRLLLDGNSAEQIAAALHISPKTAQNCHYQIKAKLGVKTDIQLVKLALRLGLVD